MAPVLRKYQLIVWDECTMAHKGGFEALNRTRKDIKENDSIMGGTTILFAGDFRQTLPIVSRGTRADEVKACLKSSPLRTSVTKLALSKNMKVHLRGDASAEGFANLLLKIGNGQLAASEERIKIPASLGTVVGTLEDLISKVYPDVSNIRHKSSDWLYERAILTTKNIKTVEINDIIVKSFEKTVHEYKSVDTVLHTDDAVHYPTEFLNSLEPPGLPVHSLILKTGIPVMFCNGTRLQIIAFYRNVIEATILTGCATGETVFIPRIPLIPS